MLQLREAVLRLSYRESSSRTSELYDDMNERNDVMRNWFYDRTFSGTAEAVVGILPLLALVSSALV